jgi:hypothetical protein
MALEACSEQMAIVPAAAKPIRRVVRLTRTRKLPELDCDEAALTNGSGTAPIKFELPGYPGLRRVSVPLPLRMATIQRTLALSFPQLANVFQTEDRVMQLLVAHQVGRLDLHFLVGG